MAEQVKKAGRKTRRKRTPPKKYTPTFAGLICERIATCKDWRAAYTKFGVPPYDALHRWPEEHPEFAVALAKAREIATELRADQILDIAMKTTPATAAVNRIKINTGQWHIERTAPARAPARPDGVQGKDIPGGQVRIREFVPVDGDSGRPFTREIRLDGSCVDFDG